MSLKTYKSLTNTKYNFLVTKKSNETKQEILVMFRGSDKSFSTADVELQKLIEQTPYFTGGVVNGKRTPKVIDISYEEKELDEKKKTTPSEVVYNDVVNIQDAIEVLVNEFGVKELTLKTPDAVRKAAAKVGASFPNADYSVNEK